MEKDIKGAVSFAIIAIYIDNLILTPNSDELLDLMKQELMEKYKMMEICPGVLDSSHARYGCCIAVSVYMCDKLLESLVGSLMWSIIGTRPDIAFATAELSKFLPKPSRKHVAAAKRVIRYLKTLELYGYCDASGGCQGDGKSVSRYFFKVNSGIVSWSSKKHSATALCTAEAE